MFVHRASVAIFDLGTGSKVIEVNMQARQTNFGIKEQSAVGGAGPMA